MKKFGQFLFSWDYVAWIVAVLIITCFVIVPMLRISIKEEEQWRFLLLIGIVFTLGVIAVFSPRQMR